MMEHDEEAVRGLPGALPPGETILWQGGPDARVFARTAFKTRWVAAYFAALVIYGLSQGSLFGAGVTLAAGLACLALLHGLAWAIARTSIYTLTNKRMVLRIGVALSICINLPLKALAAAELRPLDKGHGDIAIQLDGGRFGYLILWPHARAWHLKDPQPMLRALPDAQAVADLLVRARAALAPIETQAAPARATPRLPIGVAA